MENTENNIPLDRDGGSSKLSTGCALFTNQSGLHTNMSFDMIRNGGFAMENLETKRENGK